MTFPQSAERPHAQATHHAPETTTKTRRPWIVVGGVGSVVVLVVAVWGIQQVSREAPPAPAAATTTSGATPATSTQPAPTAAAPDALAKGKAFTFDDGKMTTVVLDYKQPAGTADDVASAVKAGVLPKDGTWGAIEVKTCRLTAAPDPATVSTPPWSLEWADGTVTDAAWTGNAAPEYPSGEGKTLLPGRCVRGWITFAMPTKHRPALAVYEGEGNKGHPAEWKLS